MKKRISTLAICLTPLILSGCVSTKIITSSSEGVVVDIKNTGMSTAEMIQNGVVVADKHCEGLNKKAVLEKTTGFLGAAHIAYFQCK
jgi:uncharacterized protein YwlG (UPF0340 family)